MRQNKSIIRFYTPGKKPQYGKERWKRYEYLRANGLNKEEARHFSRAAAPQSISVVNNIVRVRRRVLSQFTVIAKSREYTGSMALARYNRYVRDWYEKNSLTSKQGRRTPVKAGGKIDFMELYHVVENRMAKIRGWGKGTKVDIKDEDGKVVGHYYEPKKGSPKRRPRRKTPTHQGKGNVKAQKARAKRRAKSFVKCGAISGNLLCEKPKGHKGEHKSGIFTWRNRK